MKRIFKSKNVKDTEKLAEKIAKKLKGGEIIFLNGPIGAGKTVFVKAVCRQLGIKASPISASFSLMKKYVSKKHTVYHIDLFRLDEAEIFNLGLEEILEDEKAIILAEWPSAAKNFFPKNRLNITIDLEKENNRKIEIIAEGKEYKELLNL